MRGVRSIACILAAALLLGARPPQETQTQEDQERARIQRIAKARGLPVELVEPALRRVDAPLPAAEFIAEARARGDDAARLAGLERQLSRMGSFRPTTGKPWLPMLGWSSGALALAALCWWLRRVGTNARSALAGLAAVTFLVLSQGLGLALGVLIVNFLATGDRRLLGFDSFLAELGLLALMLGAVPLILGGVLHWHNERKRA